MVVSISIARTSLRICASVAPRVLHFSAFITLVEQIICVPNNTYSEMCQRFVDIVYEYLIIYSASLTAAVQRKYEYIRRT